MHGWLVAAESAKPRVRVVVTYLLYNDHIVFSVSCHIDWILLHFFWKGTMGIVKIDENNYHFRVENFRQEPLRVLPSIFRVPHVKFRRMHRKNVLGEIRTFRFLCNSITFISTLKNWAVSPPVWQSLTLTVWLWMYSRASMRLVLWTLLNSLFL